MVSVEKIFPPVTFLILPRALICSKCKENLYVCLSLFILLSIDIDSLRQGYHCFLTAWCILGEV